MIVVSNCVSDVRNLRLQSRLAAFEKTLAQLTQVSRIPGRTMLENALAGLEGQVQAGKIGVFCLKLINDPE
jgi:hypothetical protein